MDIYILDQSFNLVGIIDEYTSLIWRPAYYDVGDFELYLPATTNNINKLKKDYYLVRKSDISMDSSGNVIYKKVMIIKNHTLTTDIEDGDYLTVTGRELKFILNSRIVWNQTNLNGNVETAVRTLVDDNAISPTNVNRIIPNLILDDVSGLTDTIIKQITGDKLDEAITEICATYNLGWDVYIKANKLVFRMYQGLDRSYNQTDRPYVVFSDDFENIINSEYAVNSENYANTALVAGEGEGTARTTTTLNDNNGGLNRYEVYIDSRDISSNEGEVTTSEYNNMLLEKGNEKLSEYAITTAFSGEVRYDYNFEYGKDYYLGDVVTVINKYGLSSNVRVLSAIESHDENGIKLIPQFNT